MSNIITVKANADKNAELVIHPKKALEINLGKKKYAYVSFGSQKSYVDIKISEDIPHDNILLSQKVMDELHLPDYPTYEIQAVKNEIIIGPYIGLLASKTDEKLTASRLNRMKVYIREYTKLNGAVVIFALDKVDTINRLIEGHCYNPVSDQWQRGIFPYPSSIYRTIGMDRKWKNHFLSVIGDKTFNSRYFSKWDMYEWFSGDAEIGPHIPYTVLYQTPQQVLDLLEKYEKIYIKPISGLQGRGIVQASIENREFVFKYREHGTNCKDVFESPDEAGEYVNKRFSPGKYLVQQAINLLEYKNRIIDFRCVVQKNQSGKWVCNAVIGRHGDKGSIVSNISSGGKAYSALYILKYVVPPEVNPFDFKKTIESFAVKVCKTLDEFGINCGTLGLDLGVDTKGRIWLIEINNRDPDPTIALNISDRQLYYILKTSPMFYAKALAGFPVIDGSH